LITYFRAYFQRDPFSTSGVRNGAPWLAKKRGEAMHFTRYACFGAIAVVILLMPSSTSIAEGSVLERIHHIHILHKMAETACTLVYNENYPTSNEKSTLKRMCSRVEHLGLWAQEWKWWEEHAPQFLRESVPQSTVSPYRLR